MSELVCHICKKSFEFYEVPNKAPTCNDCFKMMLRLTEKYGYSIIDKTSALEKK